MAGNEKTTALIPSVGADGGQPPHNSTYQSIPHETCESNPPEENIEEMRERIRRMNDPHYLHTVSMTELYQTVYKSRPPVIDGLLYSGAYILAGAPKIGKSFLVAQLAYHVSTGQRLWGYEVHQGTVLYLALEDDFQRIQSRMFMMYGVADTASLHFATAANKIGNGLDEQLENFIKEHPDTKLVIIDTMQKIREAGGEAYSYASDYEIIGKLKRFADRHSICIVTVHHTRKQPAGDSFETISGTTGLLGCADGALLMQKKKRTALEATVDAVIFKEDRLIVAAHSSCGSVPFPVSWTVKMKKKQKETQDILSYHTQAAGCSDKARAKASGGRQPIEECGRTGL